MSAHNQPCQSRGVPTGGQWRAAARPEGPALSDDRSRYDLAKAALHSTDLPDDFDWSVADNDGWTVAHEAAQQGALPPGFDRWELVDDDGQTVAHVAALYGYLPPTFDRWDLADADGTTVAHVAAKYGHLPDGIAVALRPVASGVGRRPPHIEA